LEFFLDDGDQDTGGVCVLTAFSEDRLRQSSTAVASVNCLELPADGHFAWDVRWQGLEPNLLQFVYGPTKVVP
jgi:hypothetical protein